jgi:hypothetical protein
MPVRQVSGGTAQESEMLSMAGLARRLLLAGGVGAVALLWSGSLALKDGGALVSTAEARIGRPATPASFAGVARRTAARGAFAARATAVGSAAVARRGAVVTGAAVGTAAAVVGATAVGATAAAPVRGCVRITGPAGRTATICR